MRASARRRSTGRPRGRRAADPSPIPRHFRYRPCRGPVPAGRGRCSLEAAARSPDVSSRSFPISVSAHTGRSYPSTSVCGSGLAARRINPALRAYSSFRLKRDHECQRRRGPPVTHDRSDCVEFDWLAGRTPVPRAHVAALPGSGRESLASCLITASSTGATGSPVHPCRPGAGSRRHIVCGWTRSGERGTPDSRGGRRTSRRRARGGGVVTASGTATAKRRCTIGRW